MRSGFSFFCLAMMAAIMAAPFFFGAVHPWAFHGLHALLFFLLALRPETLKFIESIPRLSRGLFALVFLWLCLQTLLWAADRHAAVNGLLGWLALAAAFLLIQSFKLPEVRLLLGAVLGIAVLEALYGLWQLFEPVEMVLWRIKEAHEGYLTGTYLNRNHLAGMLEMALGISGGWLMAVSVKRCRMQQVLLTCVFLLLFFALLKTGSRFGLMAFSLTAAPLFFWGLYRVPSLRRPFALLAILLLAFAATQAHVLIGRFRWEDGYLAAQTGRLWAWQDALGMLKDYAWTGTGLGGFNRIFPQYQSPRLLMGWAHAHQDYLEMAIHLGVPVFFMWLAAWGIFFRRGWGALHQETSEELLAAGVLSGLSALMLHGLADFNFAIPANTFLWVVLAACLYRMHPSRKETGT